MNSHSKKRNKENLILLSFLLVGARRQVGPQQGISVARPPAYPKNSCTQNQKKKFFGSFHVILRPPKKNFFFPPTQTGGRASASNIDGIRLCLNLGYMPKK